MPEPINSEPVTAPVQPVVAPTPVVEPTQPVAPVSQVLPEDTRVRTQEQFEKLTESNKRLYDTVEAMRLELDRRGQATQTFKPIQQAQPMPVAQQPVIREEDFVDTDPVTGEQFINRDRLNSAIKQANERATRAEQAVTNYIQTNEQREIDRQNKEAFAVHPELNPKDPKFDAQFSDFTRAVIYDSMINEYRYGGKPLSFREAGDLVKSRTVGNQPATVNPVTTPAPVQNIAPQGATQEAKEQGSLGVAGSGQAREAQAEGQYTLDQLRAVTRAGGPESDMAIATRLQNIEHKGTPTSSDAS